MTEQQLQRTFLIGAIIMMLGGAAGLGLLVFGGPSSADRLVLMLIILGILIQMIAVAMRPKR